MDQPTRVPAEAARQGGAGRRIFMVLISALALAVLMLAGLMTWNIGRLPDEARENAVRARDADQGSTQPPGTVDRGGRARDSVGTSPGN